MSLFGSFRGLNAVQQPSVDDSDDEHEDLAPEPVVEHNVSEPEPSISPEFAIEEGGNILDLVFQAGEVSSVGQVIENIFEDLSGAEQPIATLTPLDRLGANDASLCEGVGITTVGPPELLTLPVPQVLKSNVVYPEVFGTANDIILAMFLSLASVAYHTLRPMVLPNDESNVERAHNPRTSLRAHPESAVVDSEPLAFESSMMSKSIYFCH